MKPLSALLMSPIIPQSKTYLAQQAIVYGLVKSLFEVNNPSLSTNLATKHIILIVAVNFGCKSSLSTKLVF